MAMACVVALASGMALPAFAQKGHAHGKAHVHGKAEAQVTVEGQALSVHLDIPLDNLLGFERAPRTEAERQAAAKVLKDLRDAATWLKPDPAAACTLAAAEVKAEVLEAAPTKAAGEHAELSALVRYTCQQPKQLRVLSIGLMAAYPRMQRIEVQVAGDAGQSRVTLKRPQADVKLMR
jgi:Protein of unknown function (DUF2796)